MKLLNTKTAISAATIVAVLGSFFSSQIEAQETSTRPRFIGVWLLSNPKQYYCSKVLEINMVSDTKANLGTGDSPTTVRMALHDIAPPPGFGMGLNGFQPEGEDVIGVKVTLTDRDKPITFYNSYTLTDDNKMRASLLGPEGYYNCDYTKDNPAEAPQK